MLSFFKSIFGGSEAKQQSQQTQQSTSTPTDMTPEEFRRLRGGLGDLLARRSQTGGPQYEGPLSASLGANEQTVLNQLMGATAPDNARATELGSVIGGKYLGGQNPFLDQYIKAAQEPTRLALTQTLERALPGRFTQAGQFTNPTGSSAFDRAAAMATGESARALADIGTKISFGAYEGERDRQMQAVKLSQEEVDYTLKNLQAQALPRMIQDLGIERGMALFQENTKSLLETLRLLAGVTAPNIAQTSQSTGQASSSGTSEQSPGAIAGFRALFPVTPVPKPA